MTDATSVLKAGNPALALATALALGAGWSLTAAAAADPVKDEFVAACSADMQRNNPMWVQEQRGQICLCRYGKLSREFSPAKIKALSQAVLSRYRDVGPEVDRALLSSYTNSSAGCAPRG